MARIETHEELVLADAYKIAHAKFMRLYNNTNTTPEALEAAKSVMNAAWDAYTSARNAALNTNASD